tara:strand:- start:50 stop:301 length:252 start_codon:yes stop_codon:yes gene_type:complete
MKRGETIKCVVDYDLFGTNINGKKGCFIKKDATTKKSLIWFPCNGEWAELLDKQYERVNRAGYVSAKFRRFADRVKTLEYSYT